SKGAVISMTQAMAVDHAPQGIRVNCVAPGPVFTPRIETQGISDERRQSRVDAAPLKTEGTGWDVGHAVVFLLSNAAKYITGQMLVVDGGVTLRGPER
ncbi:MAG: SDR family oxidoreductase, partial [Pseudomonadota bacterium]